MNDISRRGFLKTCAATTAIGVSALALERLGYLSFNQGVATATTALNEAIVKTTCALCPSGCGLDVRVVNGHAVKVEGSAIPPLNQGVCCLRGQASLEVLYSPERLHQPRVQLGERGSGDWKEISWDEALTLVASKLGELRQQNLSHTVAFVHGETRGQLRSTIERFMSAYGSPNVISPISLDEGAARLGMFLTQGVNGLPVYDLNNANYVMAFGGNLLESSRNVIAHLAAAAFMRRGRPQRGKLVAVHPRLSLTGVKADEWVPIRPGTYGALALGMANVIINSRLYDETFVRDFTFGFDDFEDDAGHKHTGFKNFVLKHYPLDRVAAITGVATETIARLAGEFASNRPAIAVMPTEPGWLASGNSLYTAMAIHALNALVGSIDAPGGVLVQRFPVMNEWPEAVEDETAQSGLAHERIDGAGTDQLPLALSAYQNLPSRILADQPYPLNALFLYNANPVYDAPNGGEFVKALLKIPFVVSFASTLDESAAHVDLILPASTFMEVWGDDFLEGTGYAGVSLRRPVVEPVHNTRDTGDVLIDLAARLGGSIASALPFKSYKELIDHRLSAIDLDREKFETNGFWSEMVYFNAGPGSTAWSDVVGRDRANAPQDGRFDFFSRELFAALQSPSDEACLPHFALPEALAEVGNEAAEYPFLLVTQSLITQSRAWPGVVPTLQECFGLQAHAQWSSWIEINPLAAEAMGLHDTDLVWIESPIGRVQAPVRVFAGIWPNAVYLPPGQGHRTLTKWGRFAPDNFVVGVNPNQLISAGTEALSGQAIFSPTRVKIYKA
ncbi:MAG: molybdopterin-dependent oxidoreductase [Chloroflexi bacterium]|nr:molybdopterin-dependent oxidoreductase [Chloroflexota bacterium]